MERDQIYDGLDQEQQTIWSRVEYTSIKGRLRYRRKRTRAGYQRYDFMLTTFFSPKGMVVIDTQDPQSV